MIRDLIYPDDARKVIDALHEGLRYDAAVAVLGAACSQLKPLGDLPDLSTGIRYGGRAADEAVRRDAPALLARFSLITMVSRFEVHVNLLLLQRRVLEELGSSGRKMNPAAMWKILKNTNDEYRSGPVKVCSELLVQQPSAEMLARMKWLNGIYRVRNCLAHRQGVVQLVDVKKPGTSFYDIQDSDTLKVLWLRLKATLDGNEINQFPHEAPKGGQLECKFEEYEREWKVGEQIDVTPVECQGIAMSLSFLGNQVLADFEREMNELLKPR